MTNSDELRVLADPGVELAEIGRRVRLLLHDQPGQLRAIADGDVADGTDEGVARTGLALDNGSFRSRPDTHRQPHMRLAAGLHVLQLDRRSKLNALFDVDEITIGDEGGVQRADCVVESAGFERRRKTSVGQLVGDTLDGDALDFLRLCRRHAVQNGKHRSNP